MVHQLINKHNFKMMYPNCTLMTFLLASGRKDFLEFNLRVVNIIPDEEA